MGEIIKQHHISFKNAFAGLKWALTSQPNFRIHFALSILAIILGWYVGLAHVEWVLLAFTIFWGMAAEMVNTSLEAMTDLITQEWKKEAKVAKDVAAGMMLTIATGSVVVAFLLILPKLIAKLF